MNIIGIVCEYNPMHKGHIYQMEQSKAQLEGESLIICVMSGDYVQRGEAAIFSKFARAEAACLAGADLVLELPLPWCIASAERFAMGAVAILNSIGCTHISFGSESGDINGLKRVAEELLHDNTIEEIKSRMSQTPNLSFAAARQQVLEERLGAEGSLLAQPNNILAIEYLKALGSLGSAMQPITIMRKGSGHDKTSDSEIKSASELRGMMLSGESIASYIPDKAAYIYNRELEQGRRADAGKMELCILSRLRMLSEQDFLKLPDGANGVGRRLYKACMEQPSLEAIYAEAGNKRIAAARIRRMCIAAALGIDKAMTEAMPPYIRVLAANSQGCAFLRRNRDSSPIPILTKPASVRQIGGFAGQVFAMGASAHDLYALQFDNETQRKGGSDWRTSPKIV